MIEFDFLTELERRCLKIDIFKKTFFQYVFHHAHHVVKKDDKQTELETKLKKVFHLNNDKGSYSDDLTLRCRIFYFCKTVSLLARILCYVFNLELVDWNERLLVLMNTSLTEQERNILPIFNQIFKNILIPYQKFQHEVSNYKHLSIDLNDGKTSRCVRLMENSKHQFREFVYLFLENQQKKQALS